MNEIFSYITTYITFKAVSALSRQYKELLLAFRKKIIDQFCIGLHLT